MGDPWLEEQRESLISLKNILARKTPSNKIMEQLAKERSTMRDDYKIQGATQKVQVEVEKEVAEILAKMEGYSKHTQSELANTALKRFIAAHKDFLPPNTDRK